MNQADLIRVFFEKELCATNVSVYVSSETNCASRCTVTADISLERIIQISKERCMDVGFNDGQLSFEPTIATAEIYKNVKAKDVIKEFNLSKEVDEVQLQNLIESIVGNDVPYDTIYKLRVITGVNSDTANEIVKFIVENFLGIKEDVKAETVTSGFEKHLEVALKTLKIDNHKYTNGLLEISGLDKAGYEKLAKDLSPDFNAKYNGKGLVFENIEKVEGNSLKNPSLEADAVRIAALFIKDKKAANELYNDIIKEKKLVLCEAAALSNRVHEIIKKGK